MYIYLEDNILFNNKNKLIVLIKYILIILLLIKTLIKERMYIFILARIKVLHQYIARIYRKWGIFSLGRHYGRSTQSASRADRSTESRTTLCP